MRLRLHVSGTASRLWAGQNPGHRSVLVFGCVSELVSHATAERKHSLSTGSFGLVSLLPFRLLQRPTLPGSPGPRWTSMPSSSWPPSVCPTGRRPRGSEGMRPFAARRHCGTRGHWLGTSRCARACVGPHPCLGHLEFRQSASLSSFLEHFAFRPSAPRMRGCGCVESARKAQCRYHGARLWWGFGVGLQVELCRSNTGFCQNAGAKSFNEETIHHTRWCQRTDVVCLTA